MSEHHGHSRFAIHADAQGGVLIALGLTGLRLGLGDGMLRFVQPRMRIPIVLSAVVLLAIGAVTVVRAWRPRGTPDEPAPGVGWLLILPVAVLLLVAPAPLGADAASRQSVRTTKLPQAQNLRFEPLPEATDGAVAMSVTAYTNRALYDSSEQLKGVPVRLVGFVLNANDGSKDVYLTRFSIACCAADAFPVEVVMRGSFGKHKPDTWLEVVGTWVPTETAADGDEFLRAVIEVTSARLTDAPADPYE